MIGIIPAAGAGSRMQPLGCSKELLPVGSREVEGVERPKAVSEYLVERMIAAGARQICMVISAEKSDIVRYYAEREYAAEIFYVVQRRACGLCDALFRAGGFVHSDEVVLIGLPDTIWFPENAYCAALDADGGFHRDEPRTEASVGKERAPEVRLVLFPVETPEDFDAVLRDERGRVQRVVVKQPDPGSNWIWGAVIATGHAFHDLRMLWEARHRVDAYLGDLLNAYMAAGNAVQARACGECYMDVGTLRGYLRAQDYLRTRSAGLSGHPQASAA
jgi:dTDP-glucose pyrophosphorylase